MALARPSNRAAFVGVEGVRLVEEALRSGAAIQAVLFRNRGYATPNASRPSSTGPKWLFPVLALPTAL